jgi:uncharacterized protein with GYD domain
LRPFDPRVRERNAMATYISLVNLTEKGVREINDTVKRGDAFKKLAKKLGAIVKELVWTQGKYDIVAIVEAPDDATAAAVFLSAAKLGNIRGETLRAFTAAEMEKILEKVA